MMTLACSKPIASHAVVRFVIAIGEKAITNTTTTTSNGKILLRHTLQWQAIAMIVERGRKDVKK